VAEHQQNLVKEINPTEQEKGNENGKEKEKETERERVKKEMMEVLDLL